MRNAFTFEREPFGHFALSSEAEGCPEESDDYETPRRSVAPNAVVRSTCQVLDNFDFNKDALKSEHRAKVVALARRIVASQRSVRPIRSVSIVGYTDPVGDARYNLALGQRRAKRVEKELRVAIERIRSGASRGIIISAGSRGETQPTGRGAAKDRRVEICLPPPPRGCPPHKSRVRLHIKILSRPKKFSIDTMVQSMRRVYGPAGFRVEVASTETLSRPALEDLDIRCPGTTTVCCPFPCAASNLNVEHVTLFGNRNRVGVNELAVYFVRATTPTFNGCCAHPPGRPGVIVTENASRWTLAHEVAHVLGLAHVNNNDRLMTGNGTNGITNPPPDLIQSEIQTMERSPLTIPC